MIGWRESGASDQVLNAQVDNMKQSFTSDYMQKQIEQMYKAIDNNPTDAIGKAKELVESCCKTILEEKNVNIEANWEVPKLGHETFKVMNLLPANFNGNTQVEESIKRPLGNLSSIPQGLVELRNSYGTGHGRANSFVSLESKHARLAVGAAVTLCEFLWSIYEDDTIIIAVLFNLDINNVYGW